MSILVRIAYCVLRKLDNASPRPAALLGASLIALAAGTTTSCTDVGTSPSVPVALAFDTLPAPSVIYGDTLRDINGVAVPLRGTGHAYNADGKEITDAPIYYFEPGPKESWAATIDTVTWYLVAKSDTSLRQIVLRATVGMIPSQTSLTLQIVHSPDTVDRGPGVDRAREDTLNYAGTDSVALLTASLALRVLDRPNPAKPDSGLRGVRAWPVRYSVVSPAGFDSLLVNDANKPSTLDTTGADGVASRKIRLSTKKGGNLATGVPDTVIVEATARNPQGVLPGAPVRFVIILRKTS